MARGGPRPGAGRKLGKPNKTTEQRQKAFAEISAKIATVIPDAFAGDAHQFLIAVYKDPLMPLPVRVDAAKAAVSFEKPKLAAIEHTGDPDKPVHHASTVEFVVVDADQSLYPEEARASAKGRPL